MKMQFEENGISIGTQELNPIEELVEKFLDLTAQSPFVLLLGLLGATLLINLALGIFQFVCRAVGFVVVVVLSVVVKILSVALGINLDGGVREVQVIEKGKGKAEEDGKKA